MSAKDELVERCRSFSSFPRTYEQVYGDVLGKLELIPETRDELTKYYVAYKQDVPRLVQALMGYRTDG